MSEAVSPASTIEVNMRDREDREASTVSDVIMSDPVDAESPTTDPSTYSDAQQQLSQTSSQEQKEKLPKSVAQSPLFKLPKELRLRIYAYCLTSKYSILWPTDRLTFDLQPQILRTCKTIFGEASPILYTQNMLHFIHPSDANMFLWAHNPDLSRGVTKMLLQVRDRDVGAIWTGYLSSTKVERSIMNDYPGLRVLHIQFRSAFLGLMQPGLHRRFEGWENEPSLRELLLGLRDRVPNNCDVKVLVCSRLLADDARALSNNFPGQLERVREPGNDRRVVFRTPWKESLNASVALEIEGQEQPRFSGQ